MRIAVLTSVLIVCVLSGCGGGGRMSAVGGSGSSLGAQATTGSVPSEQAKPQGQDAGDRTDGSTAEEWEMPPAPPVFD